MVYSHVSYATLRDRKSPDATLTQRYPNVTFFTLSLNFPNIVWDSPNNKCHIPYSFFSREFTFRIIFVTLVKKYSNHAGYRFWAKAVICEDVSNTVDCYGGILKRRVGIVWAESATTIFLGEQNSTYFWHQGFLQTLESFSAGRRLGANDKAQLADRRFPRIKHRPTHLS